MKFKKLIILSLITIHIAGLEAPEVLWGAGAGPQLLENFTQSFSYSKKEQSSLKEQSSFSLNTKLDLSMFSGRFSKKNESYNFGASLFSEKYLKHFPITIMAGNLSIGGIISKLKDPLMTTSISEFSSAFSESEFMTGELPTSISFSKPFSTFLELGYKNDDFFIQDVSINGAYTPETNESDFSSKLALSFTDKIKTVSTASISFFNLNEYTPAYWKTSTPCYNEYKSICLALENEIIIDKFSGKFSVFSYETPFGDFENIYKSENKFETDFFKIELCGLINKNNNIISKDNTHIYPCIQARTNIQIDFPLKENSKNKLRTGLASYMKRQSDKDKNDFKLSLSTLYSNELTSIYLEENTSYGFQSSFNLFSPKSVLLKIKNEWTFPHFSPVFGFSAEYSFSETGSLKYQNYKINIDFNIQKELFTTSSSFSYTCKNHQISKKKVDFGACLNLNYKKIFIIMKINGDFCI